jgi:hypothetical protein
MQQKGFRRSTKAYHLIKLIAMQLVTLLKLKMTKIVDCKLALILTFSVHFKQFLKFLELLIYTNEKQSLFCG